MVDCWAKVVGGCSAIQSGEHLFSANLFQGKMVTVQGFNWCPEPKSVGLANLTANILCSAHNSLLSPLDSAAQQTLNTLGEAIRLSDVRAELKPRRFWTSAKYRVNGQLLERWFMKTVINLFHVVGRGASWLFSDRPADEPPTDLVKIAFGQGQAVPPLGFYAAPQVGEIVGPPGYFSFTPVFYSGERFAGALFQFQGFAFLLWTCNEQPPSLDSIGIARPMYHLRRIKFSVGGSSSHTVDLKW